jgi:hypothetical protein
MKSFFALVFSIGAFADEAIATAPRPSSEPASRLFLFDACVLIRGINALKSVRLLCEEGQWELAVGIVRQLFELVLNMEHLATYDDRAGGIVRYAKYGLMQSLERERGQLLYDKKSGRAIDEERLQLVMDSLEESFPEFRTRTSNGKIDRRHYWSGRTVRKLAQESPHPMRMDQYDLLFTPWSDEAHAAPGALIASMFPRTFSRERIIANDSIRISETLMMALNFFVELWSLLPHVPQVPHEQILAWLSAATDEARKFGEWPEDPGIDETDAESRTLATDTAPR